MTAVDAALLCEDDGAAFVAAVRASQALHQGLVAPPRTQQAFTAYLEHSRREDQRAYLLRHRACGGLVGWVSVSNIVRRAFCSASLGYGAFSGHERRGLMTEGLRAVVRICFDDLGLHRVEANIQPENLASIALVRRLGFEHEGYSPRFLLVDGEWRDHERFALRGECFER